MRQTLAITWLLLGLTCLQATDARAITLALEASTPSVRIGDSFEVALTVSGLSESAAPSIGIYDIDVLFDTSIFAITKVTLGDPLLGTQLAFVFPSVASDSLIAGGVNLFELSLDAPTDLIALQAETFTLLRLTFEAFALGTSALNPSVVVIGDQLGDPLAIDSLRATQVAAIPEPSVALLVALGLTALSMHGSRDRG